MWPEPSIYVEHEGTITDDQNHMQFFTWAFVTVASRCKVVDTVEIMLLGMKNMDFHDTAICKGNTLILDADFGTGIYD